MVRLADGLANGIARNPQYTQAWELPFFGPKSWKEENGLGYVTSKNWYCQARQRNGYIDIVLGEHGKDPNFANVLTLTKINDYAKPIHFELFPNCEIAGVLMNVALVDILRYKGFQPSQNLLKMFDTNAEGDLIFATLINAMQKGKSKDLFADLGSTDGENIRKRLAARNDKYWLTSNLTPNLAIANAILMPANINTNDLEIKIEV